jgi:GntR family transcriptional regulator / MocR family aminotransferase
VISAWCPPRTEASSTTASLRACALREAIADHVQAARGTRCGAEQILIVAGAQQGLELISRLVLDPGDRAWMEEPGYPGARSALLGAGARILPVPVDAEGRTGSWGRCARARLASPT